MDAKLKAKLSSKNKWIRFLYMIFFAIIVFVIKLLIWFIAAFQFISVLFTDRPNKMLHDFGGDLSVYIGQIFRFLTYNSEEKPFPFNTWPTGAHSSFMAVAKKIRPKRK